MDCSIFSRPIASISGGKPNGCHHWLAGSDNLSGSTASDFILGFQGDDVITGNGGNDTLAGGQGNDNLTFGLAGPGGFNVPGFNGVDFVFGDEGADTITNAGSDGNNTIRGDSGIPSVDAVSGGADLIIATVAGAANGPDTGGDLILGNYGNDTVAASGGLTRVFGGQGSDQLNIVANAGGAFGASDVIFGGEGSDTINFAATGINSIVGGTGNSGIDATADGADLININNAGGAANDLILGNYGDDTINTAAQGLGTDTVVGGIGNDIIQMGPGQFNDIVLGNQGNDFIVDENNSQGTETIYGGQGDDTVISGNTGSNDLIFGGEGNDNILIASASANTNDTIYGGIDSTGGAGDGQNLIDIHLQTSGNDLIFGGGVSDFLVTGTTATTDTVTGGAGNDTFSYVGPAAPTGTSSAYNGLAADVITDFVSGSDKIQNTTAVTNSVVLNSAVGNAGAAAAAAHAISGGVNAVLFQTVSGGDHFLAIDNNANGAYDAGTDLLINLKATTTLANSDFTT